MHKLLVLVSGNGSDLQSIIDAINNYQLNDCKISVVVSSNPSAYALERAKQNNIKTFVVSKKEFNNPSNEILSIVNKYEIDLIVCAGYLGILQGNILKEFDHRIINIHPALLPKYGGKGMYGMNVHQAVINNHEKESGCTVHYVTDQIDGGSIIMQSKVQVFENDTPESLSKRVLEQEHILLPKAIANVLGINK
ncbi:MAG: phosphoribosylglycinamide formyltransferase [Mycoplasmataceae bacterium]|nr:phosphoribosylglycinamide formyltransferase [Mycoplasmataceae bacterium]